MLEYVLIKRKLSISKKNMIQSINWYLKLYMLMRALNNFRILKKVWRVFSSSMIFIRTTRYINRYEHSYKYNLHINCKYIQEKLCSQITIFPWKMPTHNARKSVETLWIIRITADIFDAAIINKVIRFSSRMISSKKHREYRQTII